MNILLPIDESEASRKAVRFVGEVLGQQRTGELSITLFHVVDSLPDFIISRSSKSAAGEPFRQVADEWFQNSREQGEGLLSSQCQALLDAGVPAASVQRKLEIKQALPEARKVVAALAIIEEMQAGSYTVVCLGRRGTSAAEGSFLGSVAEKVLREARDKTVWVVD